MTKFKNSFFVFALSIIFPVAKLSYALENLIVSQDTDVDGFLFEHSKEPHIFVTGGAGYIGSHTVLLLLEAGYQVTVVDSLVNSNSESLRRVAKLSNRAANLNFIEEDIRNLESISRILDAMPVPPQACIHFAGLKAVGESTSVPLDYYDNNVGGTVALLKALHARGTRRFIFSSSATVYGSEATLPITEENPAGLHITNPYGRTKYVIEEILGDFSRSPEGQEWGISILRYFNPVGAHESGLIGEDPSGLPNNLMPFVAQVAVGRLPLLKVYGSDYDTPDGTGVRDYIHVTDLADGHLAALRHLDNGTGGIHVFNLGTGQGYSVLDMVKAMETACSCEVPYVLEPRRPGDVAAMYADPSKAKAELGWSAHRDLMTMCDDLWRWQSDNPQGYP